MERLRIAVATSVKVWWQDEGGLETAEWAVLLGAVLVPLAYVILQIALFVARFYEITSWVSTLPFP